MLRVTFILAIECEEALGIFGTWVDFHKFSISILI